MDVPENPRRIEPEMVGGLRIGITHGPNYCIRPDLREGFIALLIQDFAIDDKLLDDERDGRLIPHVSGDLDQKYFEPSQRGLGFRVNLLFQHFDYTFGLRNVTSNGFG